MTTVGLCMIVKNEAHIVERCLNLSRPFIHHVYVEDTGSTDGTQTLIRQWLAENSLPGQVVDQPWVHFAHNRSSALACLRAIPSVDFALVMDADDEIFFSPDAAAELAQKADSFDAFNIRVLDGHSAYNRIHLMRNAMRFRYRGVVHEFVDLPDGARVGQLDQVWIRSNREGARSRDPARYQKDAAMLLEAFHQESDPPLRARYAFYLAQSYRDAGERSAALDWYIKRSDLGGWPEEKFCALLEAARLAELLNAPAFPALTQQWLIDACVTAPHRAEGYFFLMRTLANTGQLQSAVEIGRLGVVLNAPRDGLFLLMWIYQFGFKLELAKLLIRTNAHREALQLLRGLLADPRLATNTRATAEGLYKEGLQRMIHSPAS